MPHRVLFIDDDPTLRMLVTETLRDEGYDVAVAGDGAEGLARLSEYEPHVIILDEIMPVMDGRQFLEALRELSDPPPPVIMVTGMPGVADDERVACRLPKPFSLDDLIERVAELC